MSETSDQMARLVQKLSDQVFIELKKRVQPVVDRVWTEIRREIENQAGSLNEDNAIE